MNALQFTYVNIDRLKFDEDIITNQAADFACLHSNSTEDELEEGTTCWTAGWGANGQWYGPLFEVCLFSV